MAKLKIGLIGVGNILTSHINALKANPRYELAGICRRSAEKLQAQARELGVKGYTDYHDMLDDGYDVVLLSLPHHMHYKATLEAISAGCHCLVEKPLAITVEELNGMIRASESAGKAIMITESAYGDPGNRTARQIVQSGKLGKFLFGNLTNHRFYFNPDRPGWFLKSETSGGGQFMNIGVHRIAAVRCVLGDELTEASVTASVHRIHPQHDIESATKALILYAGGEAMSYEEFGYFQPPDHLPRGLHFVFSEGMLGVAGDHVWTSDKDGKVTRCEFTFDPPGGPYGEIYSQMLRAIDAEEHYPTVRHGAWDVRTALAAYASADQRKAIDLSDAQWSIV